MSILELKTVYSGKIVTLNLEKVSLPDKNIVDFEIIYHPGGTAIVAVNELNEVCLLKHYRHAVREWIWEIPAGIIEKDDNDLVNRAKAELQEETGCTATEWQALGYIQSSPGVFNEKVNLYLAQNLTMGKQQLEKGEVLEVHWVPMNEALQQIYDGTINDAKTCVALFRAAKFLQVN